MSSLRRILSSALFDIAWKVDEDFMVDACCDVAMEMDFGYCPDCSPDRGWCG